MQFRGDGSPLRALTVGIEPVQDLHGYDSPWPGGGGKNKSDGTLLQGYWAYADGNWTNNNYWISTPKIPCKPSTDYTASATEKMTRWQGFVWYDENGDFLSTTNQKQNANIGYTAKSPATAAFLIFNIAGYPSDKSTIAPSDVSHFQIEEGSTATSFAPYSNICPVSGWTGANVWDEATHDTTANPKVSITFPAAAGTVYGGEWDVLNGVLRVDRKSYQFNGTENWAYDSNYKSFLVSNLIVDARSMNSQVPNAICSAFTEIRRMQESSKNGTFVLNSDTHTANRLYIKNTAYDDTTINEFSASLIGQTIVYELAQPITYTLTASQLDTLQGQNVVFGDTGPVEVEYVYDNGSEGGKLALLLRNRKELLIAMRKGAPTSELMLAMGSRGDARPGITPLKPVEEKKDEHVESAVDHPAGSFDGLSAGRADARWERGG